MLCVKCLRRCIACLLVLCAFVSLIPAPVQALPADAPVEEAPAAAEPASRTVCYVRYSASIYSSAIGCLEDGTKVKVLKKGNDFFYIDLYDLKGYIAVSQLIQKDDGEYYVNCAEDSSETGSLRAFAPTQALSLKSQLREEALKHQGVPYVSGGTTPYGFDCSGFTQYVYRKLGIELRRSVLGQLQNGVVVSKDELQTGDLIFFQNTTGWGHFASHVGIYIGNGKLIHAGSNGIAVVNFSDAYYTYHYMCARRIILTDLNQDTVLPTIGINQNINSSYWRESSQTETESGNLFFIRT